MHLRKVNKIIIVALILTVPAVIHAEDPMLLFPNSDFETGTLENWRVEGTDFLRQPTKGDNAQVRNPAKRAAPQGEYWFSSYELYSGKRGEKPGKRGSDKQVGGLISTPFIIDKPYLTFLVGGGRGEQLQVQLIVQSSVKYSTTGAKDPMMRRVIWDIEEFKGQKAQVYIFDRSENSWGQICADDFRYLDEKPNLELFPNSDFELGDLGNWSADGNAFDIQPVKGDNPAVRTGNEEKIQHANHQGEFWISTYEKYSGAEAQTAGDNQGHEPTGILTSIPFEIQGEAISFLISGGNTAKTTVTLHVDGQEVLSAKGEKNVPLIPVIWDTVKYKDRTAEIKISDNSSQEWGFIGCDSFRYGRFLKK